MKIKIPSYLADLPVYVPGKPIAETAKEYGIENPVKLASNENALGASPNAINAMEAALKDINRYPDAAGRELRQKLAERFSVLSNEIVLGNGSGDILSLLAQILLTPQDEVIISEGAFSLYEIVAQSAGASVVKVPLTDFAIDLNAIADAITPSTQIIFLTSPNNPTGLTISQQALQEFLDKIPPEILVVLDEAYIEFATDSDTANGIWFLQNGYSVVVLRTFAKIFGLAGVRIGVGIMPAKLAAILQRVRMPFNVNLLAQVGAIAALDDTDFLTRTLKMVADGKKQLEKGLADLGVSYLSSQANFILILLGDQNADTLQKELLKKGVIVRSAQSFGFPNAIRVTIGTFSENERFLTAFAQMWKPE